VRKGERTLRAFSGDEIRVLQGLVEGLRRTLDESDDADEVLARLAPAGYEPDEAEAAAEFAEYTRERILDGKRQRLATVAAGLDDAALLVLDTEGAQTWLLALNDVRLALATRIGADRLEGADLGATGEVYDWLGWLQSGLVDAVTEG